MAGVRFEKVVKRFKDLVVIKELDLEITDGEFFTFVGPSGCGKSTLLNMVAGLEEVSEGSIYFGPEAVNDLSPRERDVAMVFQSYALYPHMTVYENIAFPLKMRKSGKAELDPEVRRVAGLLGLAEMLGKRPSQLSGGQRQRVALGRAMIRRPEVFLMDEPLSNLDARLRIDMRSELKKLHRELGITTIYVTHDQAEAMGLSDRVAVLENGVLQQCGAPMEIYERPANTFVAGFIGSPPMNLFKGELVKKTPLTVRAGTLELRLPEGRAPESGEVVLGVRPDDAVVVEGPGGADLEATAEVSESEGSVTWVRASWNGVSISARAPGGAAPEPGSRIFLRVPVEKVHAFSVETGERL